MSKIAMYEGYGSPFGSAKRKRSKYSIRCEAGPVEKWKPFKRSTPAQTRRMNAKIRRSAKRKQHSSRHKRHQSSAERAQQEKMKACARVWRSSRHLKSRSGASHRSFMSSCLKKKSHVND